MSGLVADLLSLAVIVYMAAVLLAAVVGVPAAVVAIAGRVAGIW